MSDPFDTFSRSAFRLETRQRYEVEGERELRRAVAEGRPLPVTDEFREWFAWEGECRSTGRRVYRCHLVDEPLTEYLRYQLAAYELQAVQGEEIWITPRRAAPELAALHEDFWAFDLDESGAVALRMDYDDEDRFLAEVRVDDADMLDRYRTQRDAAMAHALRLEEFTRRARA